MKPKKAGKLYEETESRVETAVRGKWEKFVDRVQDLTYVPKNENKKDFSRMGKNKDKFYKKCIFITGRAHPGEP